jgi:hypothetical protein
VILVVSVVLLAPSAFVEVAEVTKLSVRPTDLVSLVYMVGIFLYFLLVPASTLLAFVNCLRPAVALALQAGIGGGGRGRRACFGHVHECHPAGLSARQALAKIGWLP